MAKKKDGEPATETLKVRPSLQKKIKVASGNTGIPMYELVQTAWDQFEGGIRAVAESGPPLVVKQTPDTLAWGEALKLAVKLEQLLRKRLHESGQGHANPGHQVDIPKKAEALLATAKAIGKDAGKRTGTD